MKKVLSILVMVFFGLSVSVAQNTIKLNAYVWGQNISETIPEGETERPRGGGTVKVTPQQWEKTGLISGAYVDKTPQEGLAVTVSAKEVKKGLIVPSSDQPAKFKLEATPADGYYFAYFSKVDTITDSQRYSTSNPYTYKHTYGATPTTVNVYAIFGAVTVRANSYHKVQHVYTKDVGGTDVGWVKFAVSTKARSVNDFEWSISKSETAGWKIEEVTFQDGCKSYDTVLVKVRYTDQNKDYINTGVTPASAAVKLWSKGAPKTKRSVTIKAYSDLTPEFTTNPASEYDFTPDKPLREGEDPKVLDVQINKTSIASQNASSWAVSLTSNAASKGFSLLTATTKPNARVQFEALPGMNQADLTDTLTIICTYKDANKKYIRDTVRIALSADAGGVITIDGKESATMTIDVDYGSNGAITTQSLPYLTSLTGVVETPSNFPEGDYITHDWTADAISVSVKNTLAPGQYTPRLTYSASSVTATLDITVNVRLAKPIVTPTVGMGQVVQLTWPSVHGAESYIIKSGDVTVDIIGDDEPLATTYMVTSIGGKAMVMDQEYPFTVTAVSANDFATRESDIVLATPRMTNVITSTTDVDIYTGTNAYQAGDATYGKFPYKELRKVDLRHTFGSDGKPLFDVLYIMGLTTNTSGGDDINLASSSKACNATTPCYIYTKSSDGARYEYSRTFDAAAERFDHGTSMQGKKLYITGYCPYVFTGTNLSYNGWMCFQGEKGSVDIYLEDAELCARAQTATGRNAKADYSDVITVKGNLQDVANEQKNYFPGFASIFVFNSSSTSSANSYKPNIHTRGANHLKGQTGYIYSVDAIFYADRYETIKLASISGVKKTVPTAAAPITIKPDANNTFTTLTLDDVWPTSPTSTELTNGLLHLDSYKIGTEKGERSPSIDLGSEYGQLVINGGSYKIRNSAADNNYTCNMAFSYRKFMKTESGITASLYGFGEDQTECTLIINSGTFTMYQSMLEDSNGNPIGVNYYIDQDNFLDLRLPNGNGASRINGGAFMGIVEEENEGVVEERVTGISNVVFCSNVMSTGKSPINEQDYWLCPQSVEVTGKNLNNSAQFVLPAVFEEDGYYDDDQPIYDLTADADGKVSKYATHYGGQSVNAFTENETEYVRLLLPGEACEDCTELEESMLYNWATTIPKLKVSVGEQETVTGGSEEVPTNPENSTENDIKVKVRQLMYVDMTGLENYETYISDAGASVADKDDTYGQFSNAKPFTIEEHLNMLKVVEADTWYCFVAPFNITRLEVLEIGESLVNQETTREPAMRVQAEKSLSVWTSWYFSIYPNNGRSTPKTFEQQKGTSVTIVPIEHYDGTNLMTANYYLYELEEEEFGTSGTGENLAIKWKPVVRGAGDTLMYQGKTYAIQFPYCPMCNDLHVDDPAKKRTYYDYWTNKYIRFYGPGPQTINGSNYHSTILATKPSAGHATLTGNSTFAEMTLGTGKGYIHNQQTDYFVQNNSDYVVKPTEGYMLYTPGAGGKMPERISRSGKMVYGNNTATDLEGVPTISDRTSLMLFDAMDGVEILSLSEQVVMVYNLQGNLIFRQQMTAGEQIYVATGSGIFVVRGESETIKVMVD